MADGLRATWDGLTDVGSASRRAYLDTDLPFQVRQYDDAPGGCDAPLINDFIGSDETLNVDAALTYKVNSDITITAEALNLTNQTDGRWAYQADPVVQNYASTGRQFFLGAGFKFQQCPTTVASPWKPSTSGAAETRRFFLHRREGSRLPAWGSGLRRRRR